MTPLLVATGGHLPCRSPLKLATRGFIGVCVTVEVTVTPIVHSPKSSAGGVERVILQRYQPQEPIDLLRAQQLREDEELVTVVSLLITMGIF